MTREGGSVTRSVNADHREMRSIQSSNRALQRRAIGAKRTFSLNNPERLKRAAVPTNRQPLGKAEIYLVPVVGSVIIKVEENSSFRDAMNSMG